MLLRLLPRPPNLCMPLRFSRPRGCPCVPSPPFAVQHLLPGFYMPPLAGVVISLRQIGSASRLPSAGLLRGGYAPAPPLTSLASVPWQIRPSSSLSWGTSTMCLGLFFPPLGLGLGLGLGLRSRQLPQWVGLFTTEIRPRATSLSTGSLFVSPARIIVGLSVILNMFTRVASKYSNKSFVPYIGIGG